MPIAVTSATRLGAILGGGEGAGGLKVAVVSITLDTAYPAGGSLNVTPLLEAAGLDIVNRIFGLIPITQAGYEWDYISGNPPGSVDRLKVYQQPAVAAAGPSPEVPAATNLSAVTISALVLYE